MLKKKVENANDMYLHLRRSLIVCMHKLLNVRDNPLINEPDHETPIQTRNRFEFKSNYAKLR